MEAIQDMATLRRLLGEPKETTRCKIHHKLTAQAQKFIRHCPLVMLSTSDADGASTVSPKGDYAGFVQIDDEQTLYIPERQGNKLLVTLQNIIENPRIGLLFLVPRTRETLRVHGTASLTADPTLCGELGAHNKPALLVIKVDVTESYFHCGKALIRSDLWNPQSWGEGVPVSFATEIAANKPMEQDSIQELENAIASSYQSTLRSER
jgi:PPOX class probable FMN-dependent enzyme